MASLLDNAGSEERERLTDKEKVKEAGGLEVLKLEKDHKESWQRKRGGSSQRLGCLS